MLYCYTNDRHNLSLPNYIRCNRTVTIIYDFQDRNFMLLISEIRLRVKI